LNCPNPSQILVYPELSVTVVDGGTLKSVRSKDVLNAVGASGADIGASGVAEYIKYGFGVFGTNDNLYSMELQM